MSLSVFDLQGRGSPLHSYSFRMGFYSLKILKTTGGVWIVRIQCGDFTPINVPFIGENNPWIRSPLILTNPTAKPPGPHHLPFFVRCLKTPPRGRSRNPPRLLRHRGGRLRICQSICCSVQSMTDERLRTL